MTTNLLADRTGIADVTLRSAHLQVLLGAYELVFAAHATVHASSESFLWVELTTARVTVRFKSSKQFELGVASCPNPVVLRQHTNSAPRDFEFRLLLQPHQIAALEDCRDAGDLEFSLMSMTQGGLNEKAFGYRDQQIFYLSIAQSEWIKRLAEAKVTDTLLVEVPLPIEATGEPVRAITYHIREARRHFSYGLYRECISECRQATEAMGRDTAGQAIGAYCEGQERRKKMTKGEREDVLIATLHLYANIASHSESRGGHLDYSRADAKFILCTTAALASLRLKQL